MSRLFQLVLDDNNDADIIDWLDSHPRGRQSAAVRNALRSAIEQQQITLADVYHAIKQLQRSGLSAAPDQQPETTPEEDPELTNNIDKLLNL